MTNVGFITIPLSRLVQSTNHHLNQWGLTMSKALYRKARSELSSMVRDVNALAHINSFHDQIVVEFLKHQTCLGIPVMYRNDLNDLSNNAISSLLRHGVIFLDNSIEYYREESKKHHGLQTTAEELMKGMYINSCRYLESLVTDTNRFAEYNIRENHFSWGRKLKVPTCDTSFHELSSNKVLKMFTSIDMASVNIDTPIADLVIDTTKVLYDISKAHHLNKGHQTSHFNNEVSGLKVPPVKKYCLIPEEPIIRFNSYAWDKDDAIKRAFHYIRSQSYMNTHQTFYHDVYDDEKARVRFQVVQMPTNSKFKIRLRIFLSLK